MEKTITKTVEATSLLYDHVHCAEKDKKLKQKTEELVPKFDSLDAMQKKEILKHLIDKL